MLAQFVYERGWWEIDRDRRELRAHGRAVPIGSRAFEIIEKLAGSGGQFVSKDKLVAHVCSGGVADHAQCVLSRGLDNARRQGALFWELRAAVSLAKSLRD